MTVNAVSKTVSGRTVLSMPSLELKSGKIYALIGANGSGKTTYARILAGTLKADGNIPPFDKSVSVGYLPQKSFLFRMSVKKNLLLCGKDTQRIEKLCERLSVSHLSDRNAKRLSGGESARVTLARVLMRDCDLLILDEPTAAMDIESTLAAEKLITEHRDKTGRAVLLITHSLQQAVRVSDEVIFLHGGELIEMGGTETLINSPKEQKTRDFINYFGFSSKQ